MHLLSLSPGKGRNKDKGSALLTALFIMTLVAIVATAMSTRLQVDIYRTRLIILHDKLYLATQAVSFWAMEKLINKENTFSATNKQNMVALYPEAMATLINQIHISGGLYDLQARFNLNNAANKKFLFLFDSLLSHTTPLTEQNRANTIMILQDWLSEYDLSKGKDEFTSYYLSQKPPYYPSHQAMVSLSEFRLLKNITPALYTTLEPFLTVLPTIVPININTAPKPVLRSLGNGLTPAQVTEIIQARGKKGFKNLNEMNEVIQKMNVSQEQITLESQYFLSIAQASSEEFNLIVYTLLKRNRDKNDKISVGIIRESFNIF